MKTKFSFLAFIALFSFENPTFANCDLPTAMGAHYPNTVKLYSGSACAPNGSQPAGTTVCGGNSSQFQYVRYVYISDKLNACIDYYGVIWSGTCPVGYYKDPITTACVDPDKECPPGTFLSNTGVCIDITFPHFFGDPTGCRNFGGLYYPDGSCYDPDDWITRLYHDPDAQLGAGLVLGGVVLTGGGLLAAAAGFTGAGLFTSLAAHLTAGLGYQFAMQMSPDIKSSSDGGSSPSDAIKVDLDTWHSTPSPDAGGTTVTKTDPDGKVTKAVFVPDPVITNLQDPTNINPDTREIINPIDTTGIKEIDYDYTTDVATVKTHQSDGTVTTVQTSFTTSQNSDGTVTTTPTNSSIAPTVSGSLGGSASYSPSSSPTDSKDYSPVLNDIKNNTNRSADSLGKIANAFSNVSFSGDLTDGSEKFGDFDHDIKGSFGGFVYSDPLGIALGSGQSIPTYSFSLMGQTYILFDQNLLNSMPTEVIRNILLFVAAVSGLIVVISGV